MNVNKQLRASFLIVLVPMAALADTIECNIASDLAGQSYNRVRDAIRAKDKRAATMYSRSFWDIEAQSSHCPRVKYFANVLDGIDYTKRSAVNVTLALSEVGDEPNDPATNDNKAENHVSIDGAVADVSASGLGNCKNPPCSPVVVERGARSGVIQRTTDDVLGERGKLIMENPKEGSKEFMQNRIMKLQQPGAQMGQQGGM